MKAEPTVPLAVAALVTDGVVRDVLVDGEMPRGAGLSSSAALECATGGALLDLAGVLELTGSWGEAQAAATGARELAVAAGQALPQAHAWIIGAALFGEDAYAHGLRGHAAALGVADRVRPPRVFYGVGAVMRTKRRRLAVI